MSEAIQEWFTARIPEDWRTQGLEVVADQDEILVVVDVVAAPGELGSPDAGRVDTGHLEAGRVDTGHLDAGSVDAERVDLGPLDAGKVASSGGGGGEAEGVDPQGLTGIRLFRELTRDDRMAMARAAEKTFGRKVSWGARSGDVVVVFTSASVPVMTRLRLPERRVLDTLIDAGVARSRSDALAWCVRLVGDNEKEWIAELRVAFEAVEKARAGGPRSRRTRSGRPLRG